MDDKVFRNLKNKGIIPAQYDYYSDFRWQTTIIRQIKSFIQQKQREIDTDVKQLLLILDLAEENKIELIAFGD